MSPILRRWTSFLLLAACLVYTLYYITTSSAYNPLSWRLPISQSANPASPLRKSHHTYPPPRHPVQTLTPLPTNRAPAIPTLQHAFSAETAIHASKRRERLAAVKEAFTHSWTGYRTHAWLHDEVRPLSGGAHDPFGGWGATLVDSLDSLWIMGLERDFGVAVAALDEIDFGTCAIDTLNLFETTIRYLGGLLGAYDVCEGKYPVLLEKAVELGEMLYVAFDTPNRMPITRWDWKKGVAGEPQTAPSWSLVAELGSLTLEFTRLSQLTADPKYYDAVDRITAVFAREQNMTALPGLWPISVDPSTETMTTDKTFTLGGMADSTYEYLPKEYLLLYGRNEQYRSLYLKALDAVKDYLLFEPLVPPRYTTSGTDRKVSARARTPLVLGTARVQGDENVIRLDPEGQHLTCFAPGMVALAARAFSSFRTAAETAEDLETATRLLDGCIWTYRATATHCGPELFRMHPCRRGRSALTGGVDNDWFGEQGDCVWDRKRWVEAVRNRHRINSDDTKVQALARSTDPEDWEKLIKEKRLTEGFTEVHDARYMLRPETIESVFVLYRITGDEALQEVAWEMFESVVKATRTEIAFAAASDVTDEKAPLFDGMESFWTAETLKYFYLVFADPNVVSLDEFVFNTEAHPLRWRTL